MKMHTISLKYSGGAVLRVLNLTKRKINLYF